MPKRFSNLKIASTLYLILALFAAYAPELQIWAAGFDAFAGLLSHYEPRLLPGTRGLLLVVSLTMGAMLFGRSPMRAPYFGIAAVLALLAFSWNAVMGLIWLLPAVFCLLASRESVPTDPSRDDGPPARGGA